MSFINPLFLSQLGAENAYEHASYHVSYHASDKVDENQRVNIDETLKQALSWHQVSTQSAPSQN